MSKQMIKHKYRYESTISYQYAVQLLIEQHEFNEFSADEYIWS